MVENGEPGGDRTHDHLIKSQMLYRLSYRLTTRSVIRDALGEVNTFPGFF